ncbi:nuclear pore complex protein NUP1-like [Salvia splendens]|uniref:nuclear pore complex protein NUP1-like n=1 Tax=Salvia splendens TaxID=180675 RepID=UPI001C26C639|nr:nuclear pore complex protein NUP1-like [Salvia splendens]
MNISGANLHDTTQSMVLRSTQEKDGTRYDSDFARIEQLIKGNTFTREEITHLMEILNSRVNKEEEQKLSSNAEDDGQLVPWRPEILITPSEGRQRYTEGTVIGYSREKSDVPVGVSASPIDLARAYMSRRTTEEGQDLHNSISNSERAQQTNEFTRKPLPFPSPSPKPSICWPGSVVHTRHGLTTPLGQRGRSRLQDFPRTPYSRTILSKSKTKLQADSQYANTSTPFRQSRESPYEQVKSRGETVDAYGSVGPIRRMRNKFASEIRPRGSIFLSSPKEIPLKAPTTQEFEGFLPSVEKNIVPGETSGVPKYLSGDNVSLPSDIGMSSMNLSASQAARKALEFLDRNKPTPKQKEAELRLVTGWGSSPDATDVSNVESRSSAHVEDPASHKNTDTSGPNFPSEFNKSSNKFNFSGNYHAKGMNEARDEATGITKGSGSIFSGSSNSTAGADTIPLFGHKTSGPQPRNWNKSLLQNALATTNDRETKTGSQFSLPPLSNGQDAKTTTEAEALKSHGMKPSLPSIFTQRTILRAASSDNGVGFTFPVSASAGVLSEPPTPSIMPSSSPNLTSQPSDTPSIPSYSFGSNKSAPSVVFSFPSTTSSASNQDDSDPIFSFGSDKGRLCFSSFGEDSICY